MASERRIFALLVLLAICDGHGHLHIPEESRMRMPEILSRAGDGNFSVQEHMALTTDGYMLGIYRVRTRGKRESTRLPVLLVHGIMGSSEDYVRMGRNKSLALSLAEAGHDVWLGNLRGNLYTHHLNISKKDPEFWNFSIDHHGNFDLPAMIDLVLSETGAQRLHYVGYSLSCTCFLITCNDRPDIAAKIASFVAMAPAIGISRKLKPLARVFFDIGVPRLLRDIGVNQLAIEVNLQMLLASSLCDERNFSRNFCHQLIHPLIGKDSAQVDWEKYLVIFARFQPTSLRTVLQYVQSLLAVQLRKYDWGKQGNMKMYGRTTPDAYNNSAIIAPTHIFYGLNDLLITPDVVMRFFKSLKKTNPAVTVKPIKYPTFNHLDFMFAKDVQDLVNTNVVNMVNHFSDLEKS